MGTKACRRIAGWVDNYEVTAMKSIVSTPPVLCHSWCTNKSLWALWLSSFSKSWGYLAINKKLQMQNRQSESEMISRLGHCGAINRCHFFARTTVSSRINTLVRISSLQRALSGKEIFKWLQGVAMSGNGSLVAVYGTLHLGKAITNNWPLRALYMSS